MSEQIRKASEKILEALAERYMDEPLKSYEDKKPSLECQLIGSCLVATIDTSVADMYDDSISTEALEANIYKALKDAGIKEITISQIPVKDDLSGTTYDWPRISFLLPANKAVNRLGAAYQAIVFNDLASEITESFRKATKSLDDLRPDGASALKTIEERVLASLTASNPTAK